MKRKAKKIKNAVGPEEAVLFLHDMQVMQFEKDEPTAAISLRVPQNLLRALKTQAKFEGKKYQSLLVEYIRMGLQKHYYSNRDVRGSSKV